jgi:hypothetical protein
MWCHGRMSGRYGDMNRFAFEIGEQGKELKVVMD